MAKVLSTVLPSRFDKYGIHFPEDWEVTYLEAPYTQEQMLAAAQGKECILANATHEVSAAVIKGTPTLKLVQSEGVGYNKIDCAAAKEAGVLVCNNKGANANGVAEQTIALMLAALRGIAKYDYRLKHEPYTVVKADSLAEGTHEIAGKHIGFVGMGAIAKEAAKKLAPWHVKISYFDTFRPTPEVEKELNIEYLPFEELVKVCDILSIHVPVFPSTVNMFNAEVFKVMKPNAILVNTARGEIIDQAALAVALENGEIGHAALDVLSPEPYPEDHPLLNLSDKANERLTLTPHNAGMTDEAFITMLTVAINNFKAIDAGETPINIVPECK